MLTILPDESKPDEFFGLEKHAEQISQFNGLPGPLRAKILIMSNRLMFLRECQKECYRYAYWLKRKSPIEQRNLGEFLLDAVYKAAKKVSGQVSEQYFQGNENALLKELKLTGMLLDTFPNIQRFFEKLENFLAQKIDDMRQRLDATLSEVTTKGIAAISDRMEVLEQGLERARIIAESKAALAIPQLKPRFEDGLQSLLAAETLLQEIGEKILAVTTGRMETAQGKQPRLYDMLTANIQSLSTLHLPPPELGALHQALGRTERVIQGDPSNDVNVRNAASLLYTQLMDITLSLKGQVMRALKSSEASMFIQ